MMTTAYEEPDLIVLNRHGSSWQGTARNGGFFAVGEFADHTTDAIASCIEKYRAEITDKVTAWRENNEKKARKQPVKKATPKPVFDPLEDI